jgi:hypothetical protein
MTTKRLRFYSQFFNTAEMDSIFYEKFYSHMTKGTFIGMVKATPERFYWSVIKRREPSVIPLKAVLFQLLLVISLPGLSSLLFHRLE